MTDTAGLFARYPGSAVDEAVDPDGRVRPGYEPVARDVEELGAGGLAAGAGARAPQPRAPGGGVGV